MERVFFYSKYDGASYSNLKTAERVLENFADDKVYDINDIIELYQIKLYIDNKVYLPQWSEDDITQIKKKVKVAWSVIVTFWNTIDNNNLLDIFGQLESWTLQDSFWDITVKLSTYKSIDKKVFLNLLNSNKCHISAVLQQDKLVKYYDHEIREYLLNYRKSAELILSQYVEKRDPDREDFYFPKCLSLADKEEIILNYLEDKEVNLNYVRLVINIKQQPYLAISDKTRLRAKKIEEKLNKEILEKNGGTLFGLKVVFSETQDEPVEITTEETTQIYSYGTKYVFRFEHLFFYLTHFNALYQYLDNQKCISLVSKNSDFGTIEKVLMSSKNEYPVSWVFYRKENLSIMQVFAFDEILARKQKQNIEKIISYYIVEHLSGLGLKGFRFKLPSEGTSYYEKIRTLLAEYDALLRQYKLYKEDGKIDFELFSLSSGGYSLSQIPSFVTKKYFYVKGDKLALPFHLLFSDQSGLFWLDAFRNCKYRCLFDLINNENVLYGDFKPYQRERLHKLFDLKLLFVDHNGHLRIKDKNQTFVLKQLYSEEVLSYWHYSEDCRAVIDKMADDGILFFEDTLFNKLEQSYFNYYLNKKEFTNGLDLRNSFMHGTNPDSENELINLYYILLRIIVLTILKIDDDLYLKNKVAGI
jgi:hypothetical protein